MTSYEWLYSRNTIKRSKKGYAHFDVRTNIEKQRNYISDPCKIRYNKLRKLKSA